MKITKAEAIELRLPESEVLDKASAGQNSLIVKVYTDEGIVGIGEVDSFICLMGQVLALT